MELKEYQTILLQSIDDNPSISAAADKKLNDLEIRSPEHLISLVCQNISTKPLHETASSSLMQLKKISSKVVFDITKIGSAEFQKNVQSSLFQFLERSDVDLSDVNVLSSVIPNFAKKFLAKGLWPNYTEQIFHVAKMNVNVGPILLLTDSINLRIIRFETYKDEIKDVIKNGFNRYEYHQNTLALLFALLTNVDDTSSLSEFASSVVNLLSKTKKEDLNIIISRIHDFIVKNNQSQFFACVKNDMIKVINEKIEMDGVLPRVKRIGTKIKELI